MFNLKEFPKIINFLKNINNNYLEETSGEFITYCPYCDDKIKHRTRTHGHLYISVNSPVFNCFLCNTSGNLLKLLEFINFNDIEEINRLKSISKYNFSKDYYLKTFTKKIDINNLYEFLYNKYKNLYKYNKKDFFNFNQYIYKRLGYIDYQKFLIYPDYIDVYNNGNKILACCFLNNNNELINARFFHDDKKIRYKNYGGLYYFQNLDFNKYNNIILTEGPFDIINLYIYNYLFEKDNTFYISIGGKKYISTIETLIIKYLLLSENITFHLIFDNDNNDYYKNIINNAKNICQLLNYKIKIQGWISKFTKDVGDFVMIEEINEKF
jgi:hypothetical protein